MKLFYIRIYPSPRSTSGDGPFATSIFATVDFCDTYFANGYKWDQMRKKQDEMRHQLYTDHSRKTNLRQLKTDHSRKINLRQ